MGQLERSKRTERERKKKIATGSGGSGVPLASH